MASALQLGAATAAGPFDKVKGLIADMIKRLEAEAQSDASHKMYCDKELAEATAKEEVAGLNKALADLAASSAEMDQMRQDEHKAFVKNKADMMQGLEGIKMALKVLREYYATSSAHSAADGAGASVIGLLEVVESDFSKGLSEMTVAEDTAQSTYETEAKQNEIERATKNSDVKYKVKESTGLDKAVAEAKSDRRRS